MAASARPGALKMGNSSWRLRSRQILERPCGCPTQNSPGSWSQESLSPRETGLLAKARMPIWWCWKSAPAGTCLVMISEDENRPQSATDLQFILATFNLLFAFVRYSIVETDGGIVAKVAPDLAPRS